jgi:peptidoglycan/LPS O-acetylase OafA/YrhL
VSKMDKDVLGRSAGAARFDELDSLRGLAAMAVFAAHAGGFSRIPGNMDAPFETHRVAFLVYHSPLSALWGGHEAVILFFMLSGFVLSLPWLRGETPGYRRFAIKRICRIWIPYIVAAAVSLILRAAFYTKSLPGMGEFFDAAWSGHLTAAKLANIAGLVGYYDATIFDLSTWSLIHEMRISLVFPFLMLAVAGRPWKRVLFGALVLSFVSGAARKLLHPALDTDILYTFHFTAFFLIGYLLAANRSNLGALSNHGRLTFAAGICLYTYAAWCFPRINALHTPHVGDWFTAAGSALLVTSALSAGSFARVLGHAFTVWLGSISYSVYLYHVPVMLSLIYALHGVIRPVWAVLLAIPVTLLVSAASYRWVELPAIRLARRTSDGVFRLNHRAVPAP